jgi:hypothetical protein
MFFIVIVAVAWFVWWLRGFLVKERIATHEARLAHAHEKQSMLTERLAELQPYTKQLETEIAELKAQQLQPALRAQIDKIAGTSAVVASSVSVVSEANTALGITLTPPSGQLTLSSGDLERTITGTRDTPRVLKDWAMRQGRDSHK